MHMDLASCFCEVCELSQQSWRLVLLATLHLQSVVLHLPPPCLTSSICPFSPALVDEVHCIRRPVPVPVVRYRENGISASRTTIIPSCSHKAITLRFPFSLTTDPRSGREELKWLRIGYKSAWQHKLRVPHHGSRVQVPCLVLSFRSIRSLLGLLHAKA